MLMSFSVSNFKGLPERATLDLSGVKLLPLSCEDDPKEYRLRDTYYYEPHFIGETYKASKFEALLGPISCGKTSFLEAMDAYSSFVNQSKSYNESDKIPVTPSLLTDKDHVSFRVKWTDGTHVFKHILAVTEDRVLSEDLYIGTEPYFGLINDELITSKSGVRRLNRKRQQNQSLLSIVSHYKVAGLRIRPCNVVAFLHNDLSKHKDNVLKSIIRMSQTGYNGLDMLLRWLRSCDIGVSNIIVQETPDKKQHVFFVQGTNAKSEKNIPPFMLEFDELSSGTQKLIVLLTTVFVQNTSEYKSSKHPYSLILIDDLISSLHPILVEHIIDNLFSEDNILNQFIFSVKGHFIPISDSSLNIMNKIDGTFGVKAVSEFPNLYKNHDKSSLSELARSGFFGTPF